MRLSVKGFAASSAIVAVCLMPSLAGKCIAQSASPGQVTIPPELSDATEIVSLLQRAGVVVNEVKLNPGLKGWFEDTEQAALILTNFGAVELAIFKSEMGAESITVTYHKTDDARPIHAYDFDRPKGNKVASATSSGPLYFTLHNRWFIKTMSAQADYLIKQALGQANTLNR
jgi:hypothetical protein